MMNKEYSASRKNLFLRDRQLGLAVAAKPSTLVATGAIATGRRRSGWGESSVVSDQDVTDGGRFPAHCELLKLAQVLTDYFCYQDANRRLCPGAMASASSRYRMAPG
jgi:hypothetical protein